MQPWLAEGGSGGQAQPRGMGREGVRTCTKTPLSTTRELPGKLLSNTHAQPVPTPSRCPSHPTHLPFTHIAFPGTVGAGWALKGKNRPEGQR